MKIKRRLNSFANKRDGTLNAFVKFPNKNWAVSYVKDLLLKIDKINLISWKVGSGRKRTVRTTQNICKSSGADMQPGRPPWVQQNSERDSEGHIEQLFTWLSCCCIKFSVFYFDIHKSTYFHLCFTIVI